MAQSIQVPFTGLSNTRDTVLVGQNGIFSMDSVQVDNFVLEAEAGYSLQIDSGSGDAQGLGFGRFAGTEEYIKVDSGDVFVSTPTASSWTQIATGVGVGKWFFEQQGNTIFAVNDGSAGIARHTIGDNDWTTAGSTAPGSGDTLYPTEGWFNFTQAASSWYNITSLADIASGWTVERYTASPSAGPVFNSSSTNTWIFDLIVNYQREADGFLFTFTFDTAQDFSESHHWRLLTSAQFRRNGFFVDDTLYIEFENSTGDAIIPTNRQTQFSSVASHQPGATREFYFAGQDTELADVKKMHIWCTFQCWAGTGTDAQIWLGLSRGDVAMNDQASVDLDSGALIDAIKYRYTVTESGGTESNLSQLTVTSPFVPSSQDMKSSFFRVGMDSVSTAASGDTLTLYRQLKSTLTWAQIGSSLNTGDPFKPDDYSGTLFVDDTNQEWELTDLPGYEAGFQLDINEATTQAIGSFKASLCIGAGTNLYISKVALPTEFEAINSAPNPNDFNQGRSLYVDQTQSEDVNMIVGLDVLYVGTKSRVYVLVPRGDGFPKDLTSTRPITNSGPFGPRAFTVFEDGIVYVDRNAVWYVRYNGETTVDNTGAVTALELTGDIRTSFNNLGVDENVVVVVQDGDLLIFQDAKYLRYERINNRWTSGTLNHTIVDAAPDYKNDLRLLTDDGKLIQWDDGVDFGGTPISWSATMGDIVVQRQRLLHVRAIAVGNPVLTLTAFDGRYGSKVQTLTLEDDENVVTPFSSSKAYGSRFRVAFTGGVNDKVKGLELVFETLNQGDR